MLPGAAFMCSLDELGDLPPRWLTNMAAKLMLAYGRGLSIGLPG